MANEVTKQVFEKLIQKELYPDSEFYKKAINGGDANALTYHIPQESAINRPTLGGVNGKDYLLTANNMTAATALTAKYNVNTSKSYNSTIIKFPEPIALETLQDAMLSYNKAQALAVNMASKMNQAIADYFATAWQPTVSDNIIALTGKDKAGSAKTRTSNVTGGYAGSVYSVGYQDLQALALAVDKQNIVGGQWYVLLTPEQWADISQIDEIEQYQLRGLVNKFGATALGRWRKFVFLDSRQSDLWNANILYDVTSGTVPVAYGGTVNTNCLSGLLAWNDKQVVYRQSKMKVFQDLNNPIHMADLRNMGTRIAATQIRLDQKGVVAMYEAKA